MTNTPAPVDPAAALVEANTTVHRFCEDRAYEALEALVHQDVSRATSVWRSVLALLEEHMAFEDERVMPTYAPLAPADGAGRADHIAGDHTILLRHAAIIDESLAALAASPAPALRQILEELPKVYRLLATLEHHTAREQTHVYPALCGALPQRDIEELTGLLLAILPSPVVPPPAAA